MRSRWKGLPAPSFFYDAVVFDTEGRASEPLGSGDDQIGRGFRRYHKSRFGQGPGLLSEIVKSVAALKLLQPAPLCPDRWESLLQGSGPFGTRPGRSLKAQPLQSLAP